MTIQMMLLLQAMVFSILVLSAVVYMVIRVTRQTIIADQRIASVLPSKANEKRESAKR